MRNRQKRLCDPPFHFLLSYSCEVERQEAIPAHLYITIETSHISQPLCSGYCDLFPSSNRNTDLLLEPRDAIAQSSESQLDKQSLVTDACYAQLLLVTKKWRDGSQDCFDRGVSKAAPEAAPREVNLLFVEAFLY